MQMRLYDYPLSEEFANFVASTSERIDALIARLGQLREKLLNNATMATIKQIETTARISRLEYELSMLGTEIASNNLIVTHEPFIDNKNCDTRALTEEAAEVIPVYGMLTLKRRAEREITPAVIRVSGNGMPGNAHEVYPETGLYHARSGLNASLSYLIDGNNDTWFEYESIYALAGYKYRGAAFSDGLFWIQYGSGGLTLELELETEDLDVIGGIAINPFIPSALGYRTPYVDEIMVDDCRGNRQRLKGDVLDRTLFISCMPQLARKISLVIKQDTPYSTWVGIPEAPYSSDVVGIRYDPLTGSARQPEYRVGEEAGSEADLSDLFSKPAATILPALRYQVGLRGVSLIAHTYEKTSQYVSNLYSIPEGIRSIQVDVSYIVPEALAASELVKVSVSVDDCATWHRVAGSDSDAARYNLPRKIIFDHVPSFLQDKNALYFEGTPDSFRVRLDLGRPDGTDLAEYITPVVTDYTAIVEQAGEES